MVVACTSESAPSFGELFLSMRASLHVHGPNTVDYTEVRSHKEFLMDDMSNARESKLSAYFMLLCVFLKEGTYMLTVQKPSLTRVSLCGFVSLQRQWPAL